MFLADFVRPHVAPAAVELIGQCGDGLWTCHVLVQHFDRGAVPPAVDVAEHCSHRLAILRHRCAFRHREFEAHWKVQLLGVSGANPLPTAFELERPEPCCGEAQLGAVVDDQVTHRCGGAGGYDRCRILWVRAQPQHQRVDDALDGPGQRAAIIAAEHLDAGADRPPCLVDHQPAWPARCLTRQGSHHLRIRAHLHRIGALPKSRQPKSWVR